MGLVFFFKPIYRHFECLKCKKVVRFSTSIFCFFSHLQISTPVGGNCSKVGNFHFFSEIECPV